MKTAKSIIKTVNEVLNKNNIKEDFSDKYMALFDKYDKDPKSQPVLIVSGREPVLPIIRQAGNDVFVMNQDGKTEKWTLDPKDRQRSRTGVSTDKKVQYYYNGLV